MIHGRLVSAPNAGDRGGGTPRRTRMQVGVSPPLANERVDVETICLNACATRDRRVEMQAARIEQAEVCPRTGCASSVARASRAGSMRGAMLRHRLLRGLVTGERQVASKQRGGDLSRRARRTPNGRSLRKGSARTVATRSAVTAASPRRTACNDWREMPIRLTASEIDSRRCSSRISRKNSPGCVGARLSGRT